MRSDSSKSRPKKRRKVWTFIVGTLIGLAVIYFSLNIFIHYKMEEVLSQKMPSNYHISYDNIEISLLGGSIQMDSLKITCLEDSILGDSIPGVINGEVANLTIHKVSFLHFLLNHAIRINNVVIKEPKLTYLVNTHYVKDTVLKSKTTFLPKGINRISIRNLDIEDADIKEANIQTADKALLSVNDLSIHVKKLRIKNPTNNRKRPVSFTHLDIQTHEISNASSKDYTLYLKTFEFNSSLKQLFLSDFQFTPTFAKTDFKKHSTYETDMFNVQLDSLCIGDIDIENILKRHQIKIPKIEIFEPNISIYRDKRMPDPPYKYKPLIASAIKKIPIETDVDSIVISGGKVVYEEYAEKAHEAGMIFFDLQQIYVTHLSNKASSIKKHPNMKVDIQALLMGEGQMNSSLNFALNSSVDKFKTEGDLHAINAATLNSITENLLNVKITSGIIEDVHFAFDATDNVAKGTLNMAYDDLKVELMNQDGKNQSLVSLLANGIIKKDNHTDDKNYRTGNIYFERLKDKGFPNYLWKSISSGLVPIVAPIAANKKK